MAKLVIEIDLENSAFRGELDHLDDCPINNFEASPEVVRILAGLIVEYNQSGLTDCIKLRDLNGNTVGKAELIGGDLV